MTLLTLILCPVAFAVCIAALSTWRKAHQIIKYFYMDIITEDPD